MTLNCIFCKSDFNSDRSNKKYCSRECYANSKKGIEPEWLKNNRGIKPSNRVKSMCIVCNEHFVHEANREAKYCSKKCWNKRSPEIIKKCIQCKVDFKSYPSDGKEFCNKKCYSEWQKDNFKPSLFMKAKAKIANSGENHYNWQGGTSVYYNSNDEDWQTIRKEIYKRDNYECIACGKHGGRLECHHIIKYRTSRDNSMENLITLCPECHREIEKDTDKYCDYVAIANKRLSQVQGSLF